MGIPASLPQSYDLHPRQPVLCTHCGRSPFMRSSSLHVGDACHQCVSCIPLPPSLSRLRRQQDAFWPEQWTRNIYTRRNGDYARGGLGVVARDSIGERGKCHHCGQVCSCCPHVEPPPGEEDLVAQEAVERYRRKKEMAIHQMRRGDGVDSMDEDAGGRRPTSRKRNGERTFYGRVTENGRGFQIEVEPESQWGKRRPRRRKERALGRHQFDHDAIGDERGSDMMDEQWQMPSRSYDQNFPRTNMRMGMRHPPQASMEMGMGMGMGQDQSKGGIDVGMNTSRRRMTGRPAFSMNPQHAASRFRDRSQPVHGLYDPAEVDEELAEEDPRMAVPYGTYPSVRGGQRAGPDIQNHDMRVPHFGLDQWGQQDLRGDAEGYDDGAGGGRMNSFMQERQSRPGLGGFGDARREQFGRMQGDGQAQYGVDGMPDIEGHDKGKSSGHSSDCTTDTASTRSSVLNSQKPSQSSKSHSSSCITSRTETKRRCRQDMQPNVEEDEESMADGMKEKFRRSERSPSFAPSISMPEMAEMPEHGLSADIGSIGDFEDPADIRD